MGGKKIPKRHTPQRPTMVHMPPCLARIRSFQMDKLIVVKATDIKQDMWDFIYDPVFLASVAVMVAVVIGVATDPLLGYGSALFATWLLFGFSAVRQPLFGSVWEKIVAILVSGGLLFGGGWWLIPRPELPRVKLVFKNSPYVTSSVRRQLNRDFNGMREYFHDLGVPQPDVPPISLRAGGTVGESNTEGQPTYRSDIEIGNTALDSPLNCTEEYAEYVIAHMLLNPKRIQVLTQDKNTNGKVMTIINETVNTKALEYYFNWSFWGKKGSGKLSAEEADVLWDIREKLGEEFGDRLAAMTLTTMVDNPTEGESETPYVYFLAKLKIADSIVDSGSEKWPSILEIVKQHKIPTG